MINPLVSIIIPAYNAEKTITQAVRSVFNQSYKNYEIIIIDDGSTDNSKSIISKIEGVKYYYQENNRCSAARNNGIKKARGDYIAFLDADDLWASYHLENSVKKFISDSSIYYTSSSKVIFHYINNNLLFSNIDAIRNDRENIFIESFKSAGPLFQTSSWVIKKEVFEKIGYFDEGKGWQGEDYEFYLRMSYNFKGAYIPKISIFYREHPDNLSKITGGDFLYEIKVGYTNKDTTLLRHLKLLKSNIKCAEGFLLIEENKLNKALISFFYSILLSPFKNNYSQNIKGVLRIILPDFIYYKLKGTQKDNIKLLDYLEKELNENIKHIICN